MFLNRGIERWTIFPARRCYEKLIELLSRGCATGSRLYNTQNELCFGR